MFPVDRLPVPMAVQYTNTKGERVTRQFPDAYAARRFYAQQYKLGRDPKVLKVQ